MYRGYTILFNDEKKSTTKEIEVSVCISFDNIYHPSYSSLFQRRKPKNSKSILQNPKKFQSVKKLFKSSENNSELKTIIDFLNSS